MMKMKRMQIKLLDKWNNPIGYDLPADKNFHGITPGRNTIYEILQF